MILSNNTYYTNLETLKEFIEDRGIVNSPSLLIQVFTSNNSETFVSRLTKELSSLLPHSNIIGSTTDGEIMEGKVSVEKTVLSFTSFESTALKVDAIEFEYNEYYSGQTLAKVLFDEQTKLLLSFTNGSNVNAEEFLSGIASINSHVTVAGGMAGDKEFKSTLVFTKDQILSCGAVGVSLGGDQLRIHTDYSFNWHPIGAELVISRAEGSRVYTINGKKAKDIYTYYLGEELASGLPKIGIEFPLIVMRDGIRVARALLSVEEDGSFVVAGNLYTGEKVCIGFGDSREIIDASKKTVLTLANQPTETIFLYSCMTRRYFMGNDVELETIPFRQIAPVAGFFTFGEFFTSTDKNELLNQTLTLVALSETDQLPEVTPESKSDVTDVHRASMNGLIHLVNTTSKELKEQSKVLLESHKKEKELLLEYSHKVQIIEQMHDSVISTDVLGNIMSWNKGSEELLGYSAEEAIGKHISILYQEEDYTSCQEMLLILKEKKEHTLQADLVKKSGEIIIAELSLTLLKDEGNEPMGMVSYIRNITERIRDEEALYYLAHFDALTKLPNRVLFRDRLKQGIEKAKRHTNGLALFFIDLDRFKQINDSLGHETGDKVLKIVSERLSSVIRHEDTLARLSGDEFALIMEELSRPEDASLLARKLLKVLSESIDLERQKLYVSASIGIGIYPEDSMDADELLKYADTAMYKAKEEGRNNFQFYETQMTSYAMERIQMKTGLRQALEKNEFVIHYLPQINTFTNKLVGLEALIRWQHPTKGLLYPVSFIPLAEENGIIIEIDRWVMKNAMQQVSAWYREGSIPDTLALNLSIKQLEGKGFLETVRENMQALNFKAEWLELEVTESQMMRKHEETIVKLNELSNLGIKISIDDFGTGYSSLSFLNRVHINRIKIDYSFVKDIPDKEESIAITNTIIALAKSLRLDVVAEGVETEKQKYILQTMGCNYMQGHYFSPPVPAEEIKKLLSKVRW